MLSLFDSKSSIAEINWDCRSNSLSFSKIYVGLSLLFKSVFPIFMS
jgi:hypothetical protein